MPSPKRPAGSVSAVTSPVSARLALFLLGSLFVFGVLQSQIEDFELIEISPYFCLAIALQFLPFMVRARADLFEPACVAAAFNLIALVPAFASFLAQRSVTISMLPLVTGRARIELAQIVLVACSVGTLSYFAGYYVGWGKHATRLFPDIAGAEWRRGRLLLVTGICAAAFLPAYAYFQARVGASITDITQLAAGKAVWREDTTMSWLHRGVGLGFVPVLLFVARYFKGLDVPRWIPGPPLLAHALHVVRHVPIFFKSVRGRRALFTLLAFVVIGFLATRLGQRSVALWVALSGLIIAHYLWRRLPTTMIVALAFVAMVLVNVLGAYRSNQEPVTASAPGPTANFNAAETLVEHEDDRQRFAAMAVVFHHFPDRVDYLMGESWAAVGAVLIPRWLWPEKAKMFRWRDTNMVPELVGRPVPVSYQTLLYANFSWVGLVLGMALFGLYQRGLYEWLLRSQKDKGVVVFYSLAVLYLVPTLIQLSAAISYLLPVYVALVFIGKKVKVVKSAARGKPPVLPRPALPAAEPGPAAAE
jgi:hypothetical protein